MNGTFQNGQTVRGFAGRFLFPAAVFCAVLFCAAARGQQLDQTLITRLKTEAPAALRSHCGTSGDIHLKFSVSSKYSILQYELFTEGKKFLIRTDRLLNNPGQEPEHRRLRYGQDGRHFFGLSQETERGPWTIDYYSKVLPETQNENQAVLLLRKNSPYFIGTRSLAEFIEDPNLKIIRIASAANGGTETVTFDFEIPAEGLTETGADDRAEGTASLLPGKDWGLADLSLRYTKEGIPLHFEKRFTFADEPDRLLPVKTMECKLTVRSESPEKGILQEEQVRYQTCDSAHLPRNELSLKYYGLKRPDVRTKAEKRLSRTLMILGGAVILFGLARRYKTLRRDRRFSKKRLRRASRAERKNGSS